MAYNQYDDDRVMTTVPKKADIILRIEQEIAAKQDELTTRTQASSARIEEALDKIAKTREEILHIARQNGEIYDSIRNDYASFKREFKYIAVQNESVFKTFSDKLAQLEEEIARIKTDVEPVVTETGEFDYEALADKVAARIPAQEVAATSAVPVESAEIDYDVLVDKLIARMPVQETYVAAPQSVPVTADLQIDYDALADKVASRIPAQEAAVTSAVPVEVQTEIDYDVLADKVAERIPSSSAVVAAAPVTADLELDYDALADKVISRIPVQESVSADYIASKVAEQLVIPSAGTAQIDYDTLAEKISDVRPATHVAAEPASVSISAEIDYDLLADKVAERLPEQHYTETVAGVDVDYDLLAEKVAALIPAVQNGAAVIAAPANVEIDEEDLADRIALKVGAIKAEDFDIIVDDDGCSSITKELAEKLDYDYIAAAVAEKLRPAIVDEDEDADIDYDEMAARISEKITVAGVNEEAIAEKAAAVLSNYLPEIDADEIADKVASQVISALPEINVDTDYISSAVSEKLIENQADHDYDIVLDEDNLDRVAERISQNINVAGVDEDAIAQKVSQNSDERFDAVDKEIAEIKEMLESGDYVVREVVHEEAAPVEAYEEPYVAEESLVTVSEVVAEQEAAEEAVEETAQEVVEEPQPVEEVVEEPETEEEPAEDAEEEGDGEEETLEEFTYDDLTSGVDVENMSYEELEALELKGGVDFANMMRYNRSFIARIIQSSDDQKGYYGSVRNALLSYKKVNSNIAWGAERFHKGRETIARFKIRGKTLILYLALDPAEHEYSVYHHKDVSDNKSVAGTPMMIKVKSPRGVKKAIRLIDEMLLARGGEKRNVPERDYAAMYPYETIKQLIEDGLVKDVRKDK